MKKDLSIIIPGRNEEFMQQTITSAIENSCERTEVIAIFDGYWPIPGVKDHPRLKVIHNNVAIGQRQATNQGVRLSRAKFIMKADAHCAFSKGFDEEMMNTCEYDWTMVPTMYTLDAFHWACLDCDHEVSQGPRVENCEKCNSTNIEKKIIWQRKRHKKTNYMWINDDLRMKYFDRPGLEPYGDVSKLKKERNHKRARWAKGDITDVMTCIGAGWFMHKQRYWDLGGMDEEHGSWGQMAVELSFKAWLSGGRMVVNKRCWFAHLSRTQKGFGFPYPHAKGAMKKARGYSRDTWLNNKWDKAIHPYDWLIKKFAPLPGWEKEQVGWEGVERPMAHVISEKDVKVKKEDVSVNKIKEECFPEGKKLTRGIVYYTNHNCGEKISYAVRDQIIKAAGEDVKIVSVSQIPIDFGTNLTIEYPSGPLTMFKQILMGVHALDTDIVFLCEHDVLYNKSHFEFTPKRKDLFYYNRNIWSVEAKSGQAVYYDCQRQSQLVANRELMLEHYISRIEKIESEGWKRKIGFEPGHHKPPRGVDFYKHEIFNSLHPNIDISHGNNLTRFRYKLSQFRRKPKNFQLSDEIPFWGKCKDRFDDLLKEVIDGKIG